MVASFAKEFRKYVIHLWVNDLIFLHCPRFKLRLWRLRRKLSKQRICSKCQNLHLLTILEIAIRFQDSRPKMLRSNHQCLRFTLGLLPKKRLFTLH